ncbi:MAG: isoprenylcysteine carboxylmethyltransferase family protein [Candidatus Bathyarchaeota archaeon]|nr:MAG: isoprenylcysteine carboxylmethyltransferase family protein [Candidatus Bathyarchaeota archaeon]
MLPEANTALFVAVWLIAFVSLNLFSLIRNRHVEGQEDVETQVDDKRPQGLIFALAAFGTLFFFLESISYPFLVFTQMLPSGELPFQLHFQHDSYIQGIGFLLEGAGYSLFVWSVLERGRYSTSWKMPKDHRLVMSGPYRYVRHPSYLAYFLMFFGLFLLLLNILALIPFVAIPGYVSIANREEQMLIRRFGKEYIEYQKRTGRFFPTAKRADVPEST